MSRSGAQEVEWLKSQLKEKLRSTELGDSVRGDVQTLLTVLQCPVFGKIVTIEESLNQLRNQLHQHPSILPVDFDISPKSGELLLNIPHDHAADAVSSGNQSDSSDQVPVHRSRPDVNHRQLHLSHPADHITSFPCVAKQSNHTFDDREPPAYANTKSKPPVISPKPRPADQMVLTSDWVQVESILLVNDGKGLGFGIVGGKSTGVIVKTLVCGGIADRDRRMRVGDHILAIGDVNLKGMSSEQVAHVLRSQTGPSVRMILARPIDPQSVVLDETPGCAIIPTRMLPDMAEVRRRLVLAAAIQTPEPLPVPPPGFEDDVSAGEVVRSASIAAEDASATTSSQSVVCQPAFLNSPGDEFSILLPPPAGFPVEETQQPEMETFDVTLVKDHQGLGITIAGYVCEKEEISGIFVKSIAPGSAADVSRKICINDQIIEVDGKSLYGHTNHQAVEVLRQSGSRVHLRLARYLRGAKFNQLQQLVASADVAPASVTPHSLDTANTSASSISGSTFIQLEGNTDHRKPFPDSQLSAGSLSPHDVDSGSAELPPPPRSALLPSLPQTTTVTINKESDDHRSLREKWNQRLGPDFLVVVAEIEKFRESGGLGISLEGTVDIEDGKESRSHHYIRAILSEGPVGTEGSLRSGDEILEVNGRELVLMNHVDVVSLLKELPLSVQMVCCRSLPSAKFCANNNIVNVMNNNNVSSDILWDHGKSMTCAQNKDRGDGIHSLTDRLVKAKSDGSLAIGISSASAGPALTLTDDASRIRSRSLEPLTGLAMWSSEPLLIQLTKGERGLGFSILDYQDPMNPNETVIVVRSLVPGGVAQSDGRLIPGDRLVSVNGINLENATLDEAVQALKGAPRGVVQIEVAKPLPLPDFDVCSGIRLHSEHYFSSNKS